MSLDTRDLFFTLCAMHGAEPHAALKAILAQHPDAVSWTDTNGWTGLMHAARNDALAAAETLIAHGSSLNIKNAFGFSTLKIACFHGRGDIVALLFKHDATIEEEDGQTLSERKWAWTRAHHHVVDMIDNEMIRRKKESIKKISEELLQKNLHTIHNGLPHDIVVQPLRLKNKPR